jgi:hypothetical protein
MRAAAEAVKMVAVDVKTRRLFGVEWTAADAPARDGAA